jgi:hypothetical protein
MTPENQNCYVHPHHSARGPAVRIATVVRLRMMEDKQLHTNLRQAKLAVSLLELQAGASKERLDSALAQWRQSDYMLDSASSESGSDFSPRFYPPALLFRLSPTSTSHLPRATIARKRTASGPAPMLDVEV